MSTYHATKWLNQHGDKLRTKGNCMLWTGALNNSGYPVVKIDGKSVLAHRHALELKLGEAIKEGLQACHKCGNRTCVAPAHLYAGTQSENEADKR